MSRASRPFRAISVCTRCKSVSVAWVAYSRSRVCPDEELPSLLRLEGNVDQLHPIFPIAIRGDLAPLSLALLHFLREMRRIGLPLAHPVPEGMLLPHLGQTGCRSNAVVPPWLVIQTSARGRGDERSWHRRSPRQ